MKIAFLAPFGIRPKGTVIARMLPLAAELQAIGHTVVIVAPPYTNPEDSGRTENVCGVKLVNIRLVKVGKTLAALPLAWRMFRAVLAEKPDLIHLFKPKGYGGLAAMLIVSLRRLGLDFPPLFVDSDDWEGQGGMNELHSYSSAEKRLFAFQERWLSVRANGMTVASLELRRLTTKLGARLESILYLPNCVGEVVTADGARIREKLGISPDTPLVLLYTRFFEFSQNRLHLVLAGIQQHIPGVRFLVVGKGRLGEEEQLREASRRMGFAEALIMAGWVDPEDIPGYLASADVAIYPLDDTLVNRAKCPAKLTEIMLSGTPVVADWVGQAKEYIIDGESGLLSDPSDWTSMVNAVVRLLPDRNVRLRFATAGRQRLTNFFAWSGRVTELNKFYLEHN